MKSKGPNNRPILVFTLDDIKKMFGDPEAPMTRSAKIDRNWVDAYNTQIKRTLRDRQLEELSPVEVKLLKMLLYKYIDASWRYIYKKYCQ